MSLINESYDSLPYVDVPPTENALENARRLITADIKTAGVDSTQLHPALIPTDSYSPTFSDFVQQELERLEKDPASKLKAIDGKRYEEPDSLPNTNPTSDEDKPELLEKWKDALNRSYTNSEYVNGRLRELGLLEKFGKNSWLVGNSQLEDILKKIEAELAELRKQQENIEEMRRAQQESVHGEITTLGATWKRGVGRVLETEIAAEGLKQQILEKRRAGAV